MLDFEVTLLGGAALQPAMSTLSGMRLQPLRSLPFAIAGQAEIDTAVVVGPDGSWNVDYGKRYLFCPCRREVPNQSVHDRVVLNLTLMLIAEHQYGLRLIPCFFSGWLRARPTRLRIGVLILPM